MRKPLRDVQRLAGDALQKGAVPSGPLSIKWDTTSSTQCLKPVRTTHEGRPERYPGDAPHIVAGPGKHNPLYVDMFTPCHRCENCLRHRKRLWAARATAEVRAASRTWYGTLTLRPEAQFMALTRARASATRQGEDFEVFDAETRFLRVHKEIGKEITKFLKRVRSASYPFRFLLVAEKHESGDPHYHVLVHELLPDWPIRKIVLEAQWTHGFSHWRLVSDGRPAHYVTKYLAKSMLARVRASIDYGSPSIMVGVSDNHPNQDTVKQLDLPPAPDTPRDGRGTALKEVETDDGK